MSRRKSGHLQPSTPAILRNDARRFRGDVVSVIDDDWNFVKAMKSAFETGKPLSVSSALTMGSGTSPSGNTKLLPGHQLTIDGFTLGFLVMIIALLRQLVVRMPVHLFLDEQCELQPYQVHIQNDMCLGSHVE